MTLALYAVLAFYDWTLPEKAKAALEAPAVDPALLKATFLILVELVVVTAVALFFSTFAGPMVSAALTFGAVIIGNFNADLKNFESVVESQPLAWLARCCTTRCRISRRSTSRRRWCTRSPCRSATSASPSAMPVSTWACCSFSRR